MEKKYILTAEAAAQFCAEYIKRKFNVNGM
jgi:hypothetical protein